MRAPPALNAPGLERALAAARLCGAALALLELVPGTGEPEPRALAYGVLGGCFAYSAIAFIVLRRRQEPGPRVALLVHSLDLFWPALIALVPGPPGPVPFLVFAVLAAAFRWGSGAALVSAGIGAGILWGPSLLPAVLAGPRQAWTAHGLPGSAGYLLIFGVLTSWMAQAQVRLRGEASAAAERARLARDLHDGPIQSLIGMEMEIEALRRQGGQPPRTAEDLARLQRRIRQEVVGLRELTQPMRPLELSRVHLLDFLAESVERFGRETGIAATFVSDLKGVALPDRTCEELARIVQEGLVNVRKHSRARHVLVRLGRDNRHWKVVIHDDGRGFGFSGRLGQSELDAARQGPVVIKERVRSLGGALAIESSQKGARLEITLPKKAHAS